MIFKELYTNRLILKSIDSNDNEFILKQFSNKEVNKYLYDNEPYSTIEEANELIAFYTQSEQQNQHRWILILKDTNEKIGTCGYHYWNKELKQCEIGYDLYPSFQHHGYMEEALKEIIKFAKNEMDIKRIEAHIFKDNIKSINTSLKQGFINSNITYNEIFREKEYLHYIYYLYL